MEQMGISIVLSCYNQASVLPSTLAALRAFFKEAHILYEIIAINDGSTDDSAALLQGEQGNDIQVYTHTKNLGKGRAVQTGVLAARYPITLFLDADLAIPIQEAEKFWRCLEENPEVDIVIASRFVPGHTTLVPVLWHRKVLERVFRLLRKAIIGVYSVQDTQCGFKMFRTEVGKKLFSNLTCSRFSFDAELLFIAHSWKLGIKELPVALQNPQVSSIRLGKDSVQMFIDLFIIRWRGLTGWYRKQKSSYSNITLDDFGINSFVNERILRVIDHPRVARVAVMVAGQLPPDAVGALLASGKKIDIHLKLPARTSPGEERKVHGDFVARLWYFWQAVWKGELQAQNVEKHWAQQVETFRKLFGRLPDGINSHEHTHFYPSFFAGALRLGKKYQIPFLRFGNHFSTCAHPVAWVLNALRILNGMLIGKPFKTSENLFSFDWGVHPKYLFSERSEILYHVERDEEWVHLKK